MSSNVPTDVANMFAMLGFMLGIESYDFTDKDSSAAI